MKYPNREADVCPTLQLLLMGKQLVPTLEKRRLCEPTSEQV